MSLAGFLLAGRNLPIHALDTHFYTCLFINIKRLFNLLSFYHFCCSSFLYVDPHFHLLSYSICMLNVHVQACQQWNFSVCEFFVSAFHKHFEDVSLFSNIVFDECYLLWIWYNFFSYTCHQHFFLLMIISYILKLKYFNAIFPLPFPLNSSHVPVCCLSNSWLLLFNCPPHF